ncbi:MAG: tryptophanyl-tRNA synthetase [Thermoleophilaceae bacterium]|nr:tryptophanyl-tRNA synthetase [Thermoleophilaceae bacterium]
MRIFSGIQPTGQKHLGNYVGAIRQYVDGQDRGEAIYCIVDLHAITVPHDPAELRANVYDTTAVLLAAGLEPERCTLFRQSDVREHTELCWLLSSVTAHGDLNRMTQFKDKSARQRELVSVGLFLYPLLQAADVLAYRAHEVPVGEDQRQHIELMRDIAERFNERYGETLVVPAGRIPEIGGRVMDLQAPDSKMSTTAGSEQGTLYIRDSDKEMTAKVMRAVTDSGSDVARGPGKEGISNLIEVMAVLRGSSPEDVEGEFADARYGDFKKAVAATVTETLGPIRDRYAELKADRDALESVLAAGAEKARGIAADTLADVRAKMGVGPPG